MPKLEVKVDPDRVAVDDEFTVAIGTPPLPRDPAARAEFAVALDASPSMNTPVLGAGADGPTRWDLAREGAIALLQAIADDTPVHVLVFADRARLVASGPAGGLRATLGQQLPAVLPYEFTGTDIEAALREGYRLLDASTATSRTVVLLTDGEPNMGRTRPEDLAAFSAEAAARDVYTRPVGFGSDANVDLLLRISSDGSSDHVRTNAEARNAINAFMSQLGTVGQDSVASGGELNITVSPYFTVKGVYQVLPSERRMDRVTRSMPDDSTLVALRLGTIGAGDDRPVYALRLQAPSRSHHAPVPLLRCTGVVRTTRGDVTLDETGATVQLTLERSAPLDGTVLDLINGIDLEAEVRRQAAVTPPEQYDKMYSDALDQANKAGLDRQIELYEATLRNIKGGADPRDEYFGQQSTSSKGVTRARTILMDRPTFVPQRRVVTERPFGEDDDEDDGRNPANDGVTRPGGRW